MQCGGWKVSKCKNSGEFCKAVEKQLLGFDEGWDTGKGTAEGGGLLGGNHGADITYLIQPFIQPCPLLQVGKDPQSPGCCDCH